MDIFGLIVFVAVVYFGGGYLDKWHAPFVNPKPKD